MAEIHKLQPRTVGAGIKVGADELLEKYKGKGFISIAILGEYPDGSLAVDANCDIGETLVFMERAKHRLVFGDD